MLDKDTLRRIYEQLGDALDNFAKDNNIYEIRIKVRARDFLISTYINTFDEEGRNVTLNTFKSYLRNVGIPYVQTWRNEVRLSEDDAVKLLASLRLGGY